MAAGGGPDADENYVHVLAEAADGSHEAQVFRMHRDKRIKALARAYGVFRNVPADDSRFRLSTAQHGELDLMASAGSYGFTNGEIIIFTEVQKPEVVVETSEGKELEQLAQPPVQQPALTGQQGRQPVQQRRPRSREKPAGQSQSSKKHDTGRFRRSFSAAASKVKKVAKAKAKPKARAKKTGTKKSANGASDAWAEAGVVRSSRPENMSVKPDVAANMCKSTIVKSGPAKDWCVTAWLKGYKTTKERTHASLICWRIASPGRSRTFDTFTSSRGTPNLKDAVDEAVFTQITTAVKPGLAKQIREKRSSMEGARTCSSSSNSGVTPQKKANQDDKTACNTKKESANVKNNDKRELATPVRVSRHQAKRSRVDASGGADAATCKIWACGCVAHLRRQLTCTPPGDLQPPLVHVQDYMSIGRAETCDLTIDSKQAPQMISRCHALLQHEDDSFTLTDQNSVNGVTVNGQRVNGNRVLAHGDEITFGVPCLQPELDYVFEMNPDRR